MKLNVSSVLASIAVFGTAAVGQESESPENYGGMGGLPTPTPGNVYQAMQPNMMMPGAMVGGGGMGMGGKGSAPMPGAMAGDGVGMGIPPMGVYGSGSREERMPSMVQALLGRIASYFDFSHVASDLASTPTMLEMVYDPAARKFIYLAASVMQSGDVYYVPVCPVEGMASPTATATAGEETASPTDTNTDTGSDTSTDAGANTSTGSSIVSTPSPVCAYGIRLNPVPINVASANMNILRTVFAIIKTLARPMFFFGESSSMRSAQ
ncbi:hypothetical protein GGI11_003618 [Coemansia sp. RSA 2049]|nr:hypothetical protein GGI11_003618 [Coemansia sp. RSA 2049]KAJ2522181.1 hypothetical protein H4217_000914 [Coemansia sp. RSA 1939]KAJ2611337.1 hypothetical protein EV177_003529 [Coemansia sp. RSA 1804]KAJ2683982.1 hypothetical protein GGH99_004189 [Coemansia sp. RSA 1285]